MGSEYNTAWKWGPATGNLWRTSYDIQDNWTSVLYNLDANAVHPTHRGSWRLE